MKNFSPKEIAKALGVSQASIKRWVDRGLIEAEKTAGGHRRISVQALKTYLDENNKTQFEQAYNTLYDRSLLCKKPVK